MIEYGPRPPAAAHAAPTVDHARAVTHEATAPVTEYVDLAKAVILEASAPVIEHVATSPAIEHGVPVPGVTYTAPSPTVHVAPDSYLDEGESPKSEEEFATQAAASPR